MSGPRDKPPNFTLLPQRSCILCGSVFVIIVTKTAVCNRGISSLWTRPCGWVYTQGERTLLIPDMGTRKPVPSAEAAGINLFWWFYIDLTAVGWVWKRWKPSINWKFSITTDLVRVEMLPLYKAHGTGKLKSRIPAQIITTTKSHNGNTPAVLRDALLCIRVSGWCLWCGISRWISGWNLRLRLLSNPWVVV